MGNLMGRHFWVFCVNYSVVHSDRTKRSYLNPLSNSRVRSYEARDSVVAALSPHNVVMLQVHRYLDPPILGVHHHFAVVWGLHKCVLNNI